MSAAVLAPAPEQASELPQWLQKFKQAASGATVVDTFDCQGELSKSVKRMMSIAPDAKVREWAKKDNS